MAIFNSFLYVYQRVAITAEVPCFAVGEITRYLASHLEGEDYELPGQAGSRLGAWAEEPAENSSEYVIIVVTLYIYI